ncbi:MAG: outer membrane protein transport protein [Candidatus Omnitrophota bacterium]
MKKVYSLKILLKNLTVLAVFVAIHSPAFANGFKILGVKSVKATAMGEAFIAQADDPSAIAFNPAGLAQLRGTQITNGITMTNGWVENTSPSGVEERILDRWQYVPNFFITSDLGLRDMAAGLGITLPNGLSSTWSDTGFARYVSTFSDLRVLDINPSFGCRLNENIMIGAGLSYYYSEVTLDGRLDYGVLLGSPGMFDAKSHLSGKGYGWGYNAGLIYELNEKNKFAVTFKSPYAIKYTGTSKITDIPVALGLGSAADTMLKAKINFPAVVNFGYAYYPTEKMKIEFDLDWTRWESLKNIIVDFVPDSVSDVVYEYEYENTFAYKIGTEYALTEQFKLRVGYIYNEPAVPERNWKPSLPDTTTHFLCSGFGWDMGKFMVDVGSQVILYEDRTIDNNVDNNEATTSSSIDGDYKNIALVFAASVTYKF